MNAICPIHGRVTGDPGDPCALLMESGPCVGHRCNSVLKVHNLTEQMSDDLQPDLLAALDGRDWRKDPRRGDMIVPRFGYYHIAREVIEVTDTEVRTSGMAGGMRNRWMSKERLKRYDLVHAAEQDR